MIRLAEILAFGVLAVLLHLVLALDFSPEEGLQSGGAGGDAMLSLVGAPPQIETMVAEWDRPPEAQPVPKAPARPDAPDEPAPQVAAVLTEAAPARPDMLALPSAATPPPPEIDSTPAAAPPEPEPEPEPETPPPPKVKPEPKPERIPEARKEPTPKPQPEAQPAERAQRASPGAASQKAAGSGGGSQAGQGGTSRTATLSAGDAARLETVWGGKIRARVERAKRFPRGERGGGRVVVVLTVSPSGTLRGVSIARSSGRQAFDQAALSAVRRAGRLPSAPKGLTKASYSFSLPIIFD